MYTLRGNLVDYRVEQFPASILPILWCKITLGRQFSGSSPHNVLPEEALRLLETS